ncbi:polysaccharide deacetylase family protein [Abyssalbus ytuae]|uniref:Polysaccharide deacetylase family protein n=1 Tax=Abyssalbus ytuae TaxID=2926907 RepID=A0A9E7CZ30_9FLAO|nr:polysaccharide deacetylase family protein [Abyssalbus ytuae]UOB17215.1 polysaccharide deacetylase family protein [Abyssalbus ytuae]
MKSLLTHFIFLTLSFYMSAQLSLAERLGYSKSDKLLIVHADDLGISHSENHASFTALEMGTVSSTSLIVPSPWFLEVAEFKKIRPDADIGIHLTLTSEWVNYKWRPVTNAESLVDFNGYFFDNCDDLENNARFKDVEKELKAQIELAISNGINPTHLDIHMGCLVYSSIDYFKLYLKLGREYKIPVMLTYGGLPEEYKKVIKNEDVIIDNVYSAGAQHFDQEGGLAKRYTDVLTSLKPGVHALIIHTAYDNDEMQHLTIYKKYWASKWRQDDFDFFTSQKFKQIIKEENIKLITWKEIGNKLIKKE